MPQVVYLCLYQEDSFADDADYILSQDCLGISFVYYVSGLQSSVIKGFNHAPCFELVAPCKHFGILLDGGSVVLVADSDSIRPFLQLLRPAFNETSCPRNNIYIMHSTNPVVRVVMFPQASLASPDCAILVRVDHRVTHSMVSRILEWSTNTLYPLYVSADTTYGDCSHFCDIFRKNDIKVHYYDETDMCDLFPGLQQLGELGPYWKSEGKSLAWGFHVEAICLWTSTVPLTFDYLWIIEPDVGICPSIHILFQEYCSVSADLLSTPPIAVDSSWAWFNAHSPEYQNEINPLERLKTSEHVQRFSRDYILHLHYCSSRGLTAWSEESSITHCIRSPFFVYKPFNDCHISNKYSWNSSVTEEEFNSVRLKSNLQLYHALKY